MRFWGGVLGVLLSASLIAQPFYPVATGLPTPVQGDGNSGDNFGIAVAVDGDFAVIGAYGDTVVAADAMFGIAQGSAYVYQRSGDNWLPTQKLTPDPIGEDGDNFGLSLAMSDDFLAIGAPRRGEDGQDQSGTLFIYGRSAGDYLLRQILTPPVVAPEQRYGSAVVLWQDQLAVGAPGADAGRVDLYRRDALGNYVFQRSLFPAPGATAARFGEALAMADGELLVGAPAEDGGAVYRSTYAGLLWSDATRLVLPVSAGMQLGAALAIADGVALVGAPGAGAGEVRVLTLGAGAWTQTGILTAADGVTGDRFGNALSIDAERAVVGAVAALFSEGKAYVYARSAALFSPVAALDIADGGNANRFGASAALAAGGVLIGADLDRVGPNQGQGSVRWFQPQGQGYAQTAQLDNGNGAMYDRYGTSVAVSGDYALVGAYLEDTDAGADAGAAHWFHRVGQQWVYGGQLLAPDGDVEDRFGIAVDIDGERMAVGAFWDVVGTHINQGSVYIFRRSGADWVFEEKLVATDGEEGDFFGFALSLDGDRILIGARGASAPAREQGLAYIFVRSPFGWAQEAELEMTGVNPLAYFGASVALTGDVALVGAPGATLGVGPVAAGAALAFQHRNGKWVQALTLQAPLPQANSAYGYAVAADRDRLLVGAFQDGSFGFGAAYAYRVADLGFDGALRAELAQPGEGLGIAVSLAGTVAAIGAPGFDLPNRAGAGIVRLFERDERGWHAGQQWVAADAAAGDSFGRAVAFDGVHVVIGAPGKGIENPLEGTAYVEPISELFADGFE